MISAFLCFIYTLFIYFMFYSHLSLLIFSFVLIRTFLISRSREITERNENNAHALWCEWCSRNKPSDKPKLDWTAALFFWISTQVLFFFPSTVYHFFPYVPFLLFLINLIRKANVFKAIRKQAEAVHREIPSLIINNNIIFLCKNM